jgi:hypothetical protein
MPCSEDMYRAVCTRMQCLARNTGSHITPVGRLQTFRCDSCIISDPSSSFSHRTKSHIPYRIRPWSSRTQTSNLVHRPILSAYHIVSPPNAPLNPAVPSTRGIHSGASLRYVWAAGLTGIETIVVRTTVLNEMPGLVAYLGTPEDLCQPRRSTYCKVHRRVLPSMP